nr:unnamed protein product [Digitaria exilis]
MEGDLTCFALPEDALGEILRRLPPRGLAASRCVCKAWRAIVDARRLLLTELLPRSVRGIFLEYNDLNYPAFLSHPSMEPDIIGKLDFYREHEPFSWRSTAYVLGHCNGLLLYQDRRGLHVANPATQRRALLPPPPPPPSGRRWWGSDHLVFDPAESPHYKVLLVPNSPVTEEVGKELRQLVGEEPPVEWPASTLALCVFSSYTGRWEERVFVWEGKAAGMASDEVLQWNWSTKTAALIGGACYNEGPWKLRDANNVEGSVQQNLEDGNNDDESKNALVNSEVEWDSDTDNIVGDDIVQRFQGFVRVLGFHPYKDVIFFNLSLDRAVAYHLDTSVIQDLALCFKTPRFDAGHQDGVVRSPPP